MISATYLHHSFPRRIFLSELSAALLCLISPLLFVYPISRGVSAALSLTCLCPNLPAPILVFPFPPYFLCLIASSVSLPKFTRSHSCVPLPATFLVFVCLQRFFAQIYPTPFHVSPCQQLFFAPSPAAAVSALADLIAEVRFSFPVFPQLPPLPPFPRRLIDRLYCDEHGCTPPIPTELRAQAFCRIHKYKKGPAIRRAFPISAGSRMITRKSHSAGVPGASRRARTAARSRACICPHSRRKSSCPQANPRRSPRRWHASA